jgi:hypothetical protein
MRAANYLSSLAAVAALVAACGGATTTSLGSTWGAADGGGGGAGGGAPDGSGGQSSVPTDNTADASSGFDAGGAPCGESLASKPPSYPPCAADEWCDRGGKCHGYGVCKKRPAAPHIACPTPTLCGCDDLSYCSQDQARSRGVDIAADIDGPCTGSCGPYICNNLAEYCDHATGGAGPNESWACKPFSAAGCAEDRSCNCVQANPATKGDLCSWNGVVQVEHMLP